MAKLFKNYEECEAIIILMSKDFSDKVLKYIVMAINVSHSLLDENEKIWRLSQTVLSHLWDNDEALSIGFHKYFKNKVNENKNLLRYHKENCAEYKNCLVCKDFKEIKNRMRNVYERKESRIYQEQKKEQKCSNSLPSLWKPTSSN